jgi:hypothetical protein
MTEWRGMPVFFDHDDNPAEIQPHRGDRYYNPGCSAAKPGVCEGQESTVRVRMFKMEIQSASDGSNELKRNPDFTISIIYRNFVIDYFVMKKLLILVLVLLFSGILRAQEQQVVVPYTLADRDRAILTDGKINTLEAKILALDNKMEVKFESQQRQLDDLKTLFYWGFGIMITLFVFMFGYMIWDRRTAMQPAL